MFFPHLLGQRKVQNELQHLYTEKRIPHTMIFYGDEGLGKTTAAFDLAGILTGKADKLYDDIKKANLDQLFEDVSILSKEEKERLLAVTLADEQVWYLHPVGMELKIDQFRVFLDAMITFDNQPHVCIIDEAQTMMPAIANSLLTTLEEPAGNIFFILITHDLNALLPTIISRGERFGFLPLPREDYVSFINRNMEKHPRLKEMDADLLFQMTEGNPGNTLEICDEKDGELIDKAIEFWETVSHSTLLFAELNMESFKDRKEFLKILRWIILVGRDIMVLSETGNISLARCVSISHREMEIASYWKNGKGEDALNILITAKNAVSRYINIKNVWDMILINLEHIQKGI